MRIKPDFRCYLVTDRDLMTTPTLEDAVDAACRGGATLVQLREKYASRDEVASAARSIKKITDGYGVGLIINDRPDVAAEVGALGVHVGQDDMAAVEARRIVGPDAVVGVSAHSVEEAVRAWKDGADYLGVGAIASTSTKSNAKATTVDELKRIIAAVDIPCVAIGGMGPSTIPPLVGIGLAGFAVVSAIMSAPDIEQATRDIRAIMR